MTNDSPIITWDERKNAINQKKHKLAFELAQYVFNDARHLVENNGIVDGEQRWLAVGRVGVATIIVVAHTYEDDHGQEYIRIISARKAESSEVKRYEI
jgi:uncharacterized protein